MIQHLEHVTDARKILTARVLIKKVAIYIVEYVGKVCCNRYIIQGVPNHWAHFVFAIFSAPGARTEELLFFIQQPWIFATKILKIDLKIAEIIEVKVGTRHLEIDIFAITQSPKNNFW